MLKTIVWILSLTLWLVPALSMGTRENVKEDVIKYYVVVLFDKEEINMGYLNICA